MRWRSTIAAALVFAALLAWVLTQERRRVPEEEEVFGLDAAVAQSLRIERADEPTIVLEKQDNGWVITEPFQGLADPDEADRLIKAVVELKPLSSREDVDLSSEDFGLAEAPLTATLTTTDGRQVQVSVGDETPLGNERYAKVSGARRRGGDDRLYVVSSILRTTLWKDPGQLRDKKVARFESEDVNAIELSHGDQQIAVVRATGDEDAKWRMTAPLETVADEWNTKSVIDALRDLRAEDFLSEAKTDAELGLDSPQARVTLTMDDGSTLTVSFGKTADVEIGDPATSTNIVYTRTSQRDEVLLVKAEVLDKVRKSAFDLRDKSVLRFDRADVQRFTVERSRGLSFTVARRPDGWFVEKPQSFEARQSKIDDILWDLEDLSAVKFVTESADQAKLREYGLAVPQTAITIHLRGAEPVKVLIGDETPEGNYYCKTSESPQVVEISQFLMGDLPEDIEALKSTEYDEELEGDFPQTETSSDTTAGGP